MAWEDRTPFEAIEYQFGINENQVRTIMRNNFFAAGDFISGREVRESGNPWQELKCASLSPVWSWLPLPRP